MVNRYKAFKEDDGRYRVYYCPSAPTHYSDRIPYDGRIYDFRTAAYRRADSLNKRDKRQRQAVNQDTTSLPDAC